MIQVLFFQKEGLFTGFECKGHAPSPGNLPGIGNLLCAGVSTLVQTVHSFSKVEGFLSEEVKESGYILCHYKTEMNQPAQEILKLLEFGLQALYHQNKTAIDIQYKNKD